MQTAEDRLREAAPRLDRPRTQEEWHRAFLAFKQTLPPPVTVVPLGRGITLHIAR